MRTFWRLFLLFKPQAKWLLFGFFLSLCATLAGVLLMAISGHFIAAMGLAGVAGVSLNYFTPAALIRACAMVRSGGRYIERLFTHSATFRLLEYLRVWVYSCLEPLMPAHVQGFRTGDLFARLKSDIDRLERFYLTFLIPVLVSFVVVLLLFFFLARYDVFLAFIVGAFCFVAGFGFSFLNAWQTWRLEKEDVALNTAFSSSLTTTFHSMAEAQVYAFEREDTSFCAVNQSLVQLQKRTARRLMYVQHLLTFCGSLALVATLFFMAPAVEAKTLSGPVFSLMALLVLAVFESLSVLPAAFSSLPGTLASAQRLFDLLDVSVPPQGRQMDRGEGFSLEVRDVDFAYQAGSSLVLRDFSFSLNQGEKIAIVGPSGVGKSSLFNLLNKFWVPQSGEILLNGRGLSAYTDFAVRSAFSTLDQSAYIFDTTVRENLLFAKPDASEKELEEVCRVACFDEVLATLPEGYETYVGHNGAQLSGGQRKRLALARALLKDAPCVLLDEPFESLDDATAARVVGRLFLFLEGRALILISHRSVGLEQMDRVLHLSEHHVLSER